MMNDFLQSVGAGNQEKPKVSAPAPAPAEVKAPQPLDRWFDIIRPETVNIILGHKGKGKSALAYFLMETMSNRYKLTPHIVGLPDDKHHLVPSHYTFGVLEDAGRYPNSIVLIDEGSTMLPAGAKLEEMVKGYQALSRQRNQLILFIFHASSDAGSRILRGIDTILLKEPSKRQIEHGSKDNWWYNLLTEAKGQFKTISEMGNDKRGYTYVDSEEPEFRGILQNPLASFWCDDLSKAWSGVMVEPAIEVPAPVPATMPTIDNQATVSDVAKRLIEEIEEFDEGQLRYALSLFMGNPTDKAVEALRQFSRYSRSRLQEMLKERELSTTGLHLHLAARLAAYEQKEGGD